LDEWIFFLKTSEIPANAKAKGLPEARERLRIDHLSQVEQQQYDAHMEALRYQRSVIQTSLIDGRAEGRVEGLAEGLAKGLVEGRVEGEREKTLSIARKALEKGMGIEDIMELTAMTKEEIELLQLK
jgi:predicted transposase YdaD